MFFSALERTRRGVVACVFDTTDRVQHMFYRYLDPALRGGKHAGVIEQLYRDMDRLVGEDAAIRGRRTPLCSCSPTTASALSGAAST